jgi:AmmeMemoRadiSam system protein A
MTPATLGIVAPHPPIMVPEVGGARSEVTADSTKALEYAASLLERLDPDAVVIMSPHAPVTRTAFIVDESERLAGDLGAFGAHRVRFNAAGDPTLARAIIAEAAADDIQVLSRFESPLLEAGTLDHGVMVPLSFLDREGRYPVVVLSLSYLPLSVHHALGRAIARATAGLGRRVAFLASGDCSHRLTPDAPAGFSPHAAEFDQALVRLLEAGDFDGLECIDPALINEAGECGLRSFVTLGGFVEDSDACTRVLAYEGPWGVGYLTAVVTSPSLLDPLATHGCDAQEASPASTAGSGTSAGAAPESGPVTLARRTIEAYVRGGRIPETPSAEGLLAERHGAFVSLHRNGGLRGCIGTIEATRPTLAEEIVHNAVQAATADPRFPPVTSEELDDLEISVDVLGPAQPATMADLDPKTWGVIVTSGWRRGLLLPDLDGVDTPDEQVSIALRKAGIGPTERFELERFRVDRYH